MKSPIFALFICLICLAAGTSCKKNAISNCNSFNISTDLQAELNNLSTAGSAYGNDPTTANCNAYKNAYQNYIDGLRGLESCAKAVGSLAAFQASLDDAEAELATLC